MSKTATSADLPRHRSKFPALPLYNSIGARLLLLLLIAELPLVVLSTGLVLQNDRLLASDAVSRTVATQASALSHFGADLAAAISVAEAAAAVSPAMAVGAGCEELVRVLAKAGAVHVADVAIFHGPILRCSAVAGAAGAREAWAVPPVSSPGALIGREGGLYLVYRIGADPALPAVAVVRLKLASGGASATPELPGPVLWVQQGDEWLPVGAGANVMDEPANAARLPANGTPMRLRARDGHDSLFSAIPLPPGVGRQGGRIVAGSDIRGAVISAGRGFALRLLEVSAFMLSEFLLIAGGVSLVASQPLRRLNVAVDRWRTSGKFDVVQPSGPTEVFELARSFAQATVSLDQREAELRGSIAQQEVLLQEIHHRVKNNLQIIASLLNLQASRIKVPEARAEFQSARDRVRALATLHRHLYAHGELQLIDMRAFFAELCSQLFQGVAEVEGDRITLTIIAPGVNMTSDQAVPIALIVTETVGNALKYAFPEGRAGHIDLSLILNEANAVTLTIRDDGIGFEQQSQREAQAGLGLQLVRGFARQLGGSLTVSSDAGTCYRLDMAIEQQRKGDGGAAGPDAA